MVFEAFNIWNSNFYWISVTKWQSISVTNEMWHTRTHSFTRYNVFSTYKKIVDSHFRKAEKHELLKKSSQTSDLNDRISFFSSNFTLFTQHNQKILNGQINFVLIYFFMLDNFGLFTINAAKIKWISNKFDRIACVGWELQRLNHINKFYCDGNQKVTKRNDANSKTITSIDIEFCTNE